MPPHPNETLIHEVWMAISHGDVDELRLLVHEKAQWVATGDSPWAGEYEGFDEVIHLLARIGEEMESFDANILDTLASKARVMLMCHVSATIGERALECDYVILAQVDDGLIASVWSCPMQPKVLRAFWTNLRGAEVRPLNP